MKKLTVVYTLIMLLILCASRTKDSTKKYFSEGLFKLSASDFKGAIEDFNKALELDKKNYKNYCYRGIAKKLSGDNAGAEEDFKAAKKAGHMSDIIIKSELKRYKALYTTLGDSSEIFKHGNLIAPELVEKMPGVLKGRFRGVRGMPVRVFGLDMDNDGRKDYIVTGFYGDDKPTDNWYKKYVYFVNSNGEIKSKRDWYWPMGFSYNWFAKLDKGSMLYYFELNGDADNSDYKLLSFDPESWESTCVFEINPVIMDETRGNKVYWGYPGDIQDLIVKNENNTIKLLATFDEPKGSGVPYIFFKGKTTQPEQGDYGEFRNLKTYYTLDELIKKHKEIEASLKTEKSGITK